MQRRTRRLIGAVALIAALAAGGAAFTASNSFTNPNGNTAGYGNVQVSGATMSDVHNVLSTDGTAIDTVDLTFTAGIPADATVTAGFGPTASSPPATLPVTCTTVDVARLAYTCDFTTNGGAPGTPPPVTASSNEFAVAVVH